MVSISHYFYSFIPIFYSIVFQNIPIAQKIFTMIYYYHNIFYKKYRKKYNNINL
jgi:hypothetical protein